MIPFITPQPPAVDGIKRLTEKSSTTSLSRAFNDPLVSPPVLFEPKLIAGREPGWDEMFERVLMRWLDVVLAEKHTRTSM